MGNFQLKIPADRIKVEYSDHEISVLKKVQIHGVAKFYDKIEESGEFYHVIEYIEGKNLSKIVKHEKNKLNEKNITKWIIQLCKILSKLHSYNPMLFCGKLDLDSILINNKNHICITYYKPMIKLNGDEIDDAKEVIRFMKYLKTRNRKSSFSEDFLSTIEIISKEPISLKDIIDNLSGLKLKVKRNSQYYRNENSSDIINKILKEAISIPDSNGLINNKEHEITWKKIQERILQNQLEEHPEKKDFFDIHFSCSFAHSIRDNMIFLLVTPNAYEIFRKELKGLIMIESEKVYGKVLEPFFIIYKR